MLGKKCHCCSSKSILIILKASGALIYTCHKILYWGEKQGNHFALQLLYFFFKSAFCDDTFKGGEVSVIETEMKCVITAKNKNYCKYILH